MEGRRSSSSTGTVIAFFSAFETRLNRMLSLFKGAFFRLISRNYRHRFSRWVSRTGSTSPTDSNGCCTETFEDGSGAPSVEGLNGTECCGWSNSLATSRKAACVSTAEDWAWCFFFCLLRRLRDCRIGPTSPIDSSRCCSETFEDESGAVSGKLVCASTAFPVVSPIFTSLP